jgi:PPOX class probable F420-dependent enzyme
MSKKRKAGVTGIPLHEWMTVLHPNDSCESRIPVLSRRNEMVRFVDGYNRRMAIIPSSAREFLATGPLAHVVTLGPDGTPYVTLAWAGFDGDEVVWATFFGTDQYKLRNLRRDPRIALSFQAHEHTGEGLHPYLVISGRATVTEGGALEVMDRLAEFYLGPGQKYPMRDAPPGVVTRVTVEKIYGQGPWGQGPKS